jgi:hypothetical protein
MQSAGASRSSGRPRGGLCSPTLAWRPGIRTWNLRLAYATRNRLSHGYATVDYEVLWATAHDAVPRMVAAARVLLENRT